MSPKRHYTPVEANRAIAEIEPIVRDLSQRAVTLREMRAEVPGRPARRPVPESLVDPGYFRELLALNEGIRDLSRRGCVLKDLASGIVDFPARLEGREVCLCWMLGEESISHWHELDSGFRGRRPIEADLEFEGGETQ